MKHAWTLTKVRMRLALRNRAFLFFSLVFPLVFLFLFLGLFARGNVSAVPYMLASVLALTIMGSFWGLSMQLVTFREQGILRRFRIAPVGAGAMLASSIASNYLLTLPTVFIEFTLARHLFHMRQWGNLWGVFILVTLGIVTFASLGLIVASVTNTAQETQVINQLLWSAFLFLSGATLPLPMLPGWIQSFALFMPATYLVVGLERVLIAHVGAYAIRAELLSLAVCAGDCLRRQPATVPLGARIESAAQRQALGGVRNHSVCAAGHMGNFVRPCALDREPPISCPRSNKPHRARAKGSA